MEYREIQPGAALRRVVECFWVLEGSGRGPGADRIFPDGCIEIILNFGDPFKEITGDGEGCKQPRGFVVGEMRRPITIAPDGRVGVFGVRLRPGGGYSVFGFPQQELTDRTVGLDLIWNGRAQRLEQQIQEADSDRGRGEAAAAFLVDQLVEAKEPDRVLEAAVDGILAAEGLLAVDELSGRLGVSRRQLERSFVRQVGLGPKLFSRIIRFQSILKALERKDRDGWLGVALQCGYYDQSHFIREFKEFSGETPTRYVKHERELADYFTRKSRTTR